MQSFNVLARDQDIYRHYVIEASAGTGKTFAIENILARFLIGIGEGIPLEKILVVTFTRAATNDLKLRIRGTIERALFLCKQRLSESFWEETIPDYLLDLFEKDSEVVLSAKRKFEQALFCFDQAQIFTIHSFCWRMLSNYVFEGNLGLNTSGGDEGVSNHYIYRVIRDFLRTELREEIYSSEQLKIVLKEHGNSDEILTKALLSFVSKSGEIIPSRSFSELLGLFQIKMKELKEREKFSSEKIIEDFLIQAPSYKGLCDVKRQIKSESLEKVKNFAELFDQEDWNAEDFNLLIKDGLFIAEALSPSQLSIKGNKSTFSLHYPHLISSLKADLEALVLEARSYSAIFIRMAYGCQNHLAKVLSEEEMLRYDDLLIAMLEGLNHPLFAEKVKKNYQVAIIDEFQDTDPCQWEIFRRLFFNSKLPWEGFFYLVGDPKQSIYAFRQADIYTYLSAATSLGSSRATLDTNYRSQPSLVEGLNLLFRSTPHFIPLPRLSQSLPFQEVQAGMIKNKIFADKGASIQFFLSENKSKNELEEDFFPFIAQQIISLHSHDRISFEQFAILVSDRFQAFRISSYLKMLNIPVISQKSASLADSLALNAIREVLRGVLYLRNESAFKMALGGKLIGWNQHEIHALSDQEKFHRVFKKFYKLRRTLIEESFIQFYEQLMQTVWSDDGLTLIAKLLSQRDGLEFYLELQQISELLLEYQTQQHTDPEELLSFLDEFKELSENEDERMKSKGELGKNAVQILTVHSSKGLEFDIVFALGLISRTKEPELLVSFQNDSKTCFKAVLDENDPWYKQQCEEVDSEKSRQLYVAMTRAKYRLYLPVAIMNDKKPLKKGTASPMELFLARLGQEETDLEGLYERIQSYNGKELEKLLKENFQADISLCRLNEKLEVPPFEEEGEAIELYPPKKVNVPGKAQFVHSFTSLMNAFESKLNEFYLENVPHHFDAPIKNPHTMPSGNQTGNLLHKILENLSFDAVRQMSSSEELSFFVKPYVANTLFEEWEEAICLMVYTALKSPLPETSFCLADIDDKKAYREMEFLFPYKKEIFLEEIMTDQGYLKGIIDLIFEYNDKYYILDWKSNWLGPDEQHYHKKNLEQAMEMNRYYLQAEIYTKALERYLAIIDPRPFQEIFGGVYYLFLRGVSSKNLGILYVEGKELCLV